MKVTPLRIVIAAVLAGLLGLGAGLLTNGPGPLLGTELGQRMLNDAITAGTPTPDDVPVARRGEAIPQVAVGLLDLGMALAAGHGDGLVPLVRQLGRGGGAGGAHRPMRR